MSRQPSSNSLPAEAGGASFGLWLGALSMAGAGAATGLIDGLWSYSALSQFLPTLADKLLLLMHLALSYACAGAILGSLIGIGVWILRRYSQLPRILAALSGRQGQTEVPALTHLSHALAGLPILAFATSIAFWNSQQILLTRKHLGLVIAVTMVMTIIALILASLALLVVAPLLRACMRPLAKIDLLSSRLAVALTLGTATLATGFFMNKFWVGKIGPLPWSQLWPLPAGLLLIVLMPAFVSALLRKRSHRTGDSAHAARRPLALVLVGVPLMALSLGITFFVSARGIDTRPVFVIARSMGLVMIAFGLAIPCSILASAVVESFLRSRGKEEGGLSNSHAAPYITALLLLLAGAFVASLLTWKTLTLLPLRPLWTTLAGLALCAGTYRIARPWATALVSKKASLLIPAGLLALGALFAGVLATGSYEAVRKSQVLHSGLGDYLARSYRMLGDWDRDGYSRWLGGGDCNDSDPRVHPNADEIPFDGIDNNCLRGDVAKRNANATEFTAPPQDLDPNFNVIMITIDTVRADHLGAYGYERDTTPNIDALAASGTLFLNGWAHAPSTRYSIPALLTGRYPLNVSYAPIPGQWPGLQEKNLTIAEVLKGQGFTTGAILNYWYFDQVRNMNQGFDHYDNQNRRLHRAVKGTGPAKTSGTSAKEQSDKALKYIDEHGNERFFLWVHYYDPHFDYETHEGTPTFGPEKIDAYDHEIAFTDQQIGRVLDDLKARGLDKKTVIVLTGDHGEGFGEHGIDLHGYHLYAAQTKVPFIIRVPGVAPSQVQMPASHVDVLPTLANLAGAASDATMLGQSLVGVIGGSTDRNAERYVFQQLSYENNNEYRGAASSKCHILYNVSPNLSWELYRVDEDPMEVRDIIDSPGECAGARAALETWYDHSEIPEGAEAALLTEAPALEVDMAVDYAKSIRLRDLTMPSKVRRGESIELQYTWEALGSPPPGWKVFAHFESKTGARFTDDHEPPRPFSWWRTGQHIRYTRALQISKTQKAGVYQLWFGLYKGNDRLDPMLGGDAKAMTVHEMRLDLLTIEVVP